MPSNNLAAQIRTAFAARGWSQFEAARMLRISPQYISDLLSGNRPLSANLARKMEAMGFPARDWFMKQAQAKFGDAP